MTKEDIGCFTSIAICCILLTIIGICMTKQWENEEDVKCCTCCNECIKDGDKE